MQVFADVITIGDELLIGQVIDTNSAYIASELSRLGISVRRIFSVPDKATDIANTLNDSMQHADITILTGGLGPTSDDITKATLASFFNGRLILHEPSLKAIEKRWGIGITGRNRKQAEIPDVCVPLINNYGTAPGMLFRQDGKMIFSLPGVPFEMKALMQKEVIPAILKSFVLPVKLYTTVLTTGLSESYTADLIKDWEDNLSSEYSLAYLPSPGILKLRLSVAGDNKEQLKPRLKKKINQLVNILGEKYVFGFDDDTLQLVVGNKLKDAQQTLSLAESCTGGYIAHLITSVPGASGYFLGSAIPYSNQAKSKLLKVSQDDIESEGAVSATVVEQMAVGVQQLFSTDFSIATSGIAGPDGGTDAKPVGTVWIATASPDKIVSQKYLLGDNRERNIIRASLTALNMLRISINGYNKK
jgi:nicotinamide-nucleotide amidase